MKNQPNTVFVGIPCSSGYMPSMTVQALMSLRKPVACGFMVVERQMIEKARNAIAVTALKNNFSHLLFIDDDNPVPPETLELMLQDDKDIVIAPILTRNPPHALCAFYAKDVPIKKKGSGTKILRGYDNIVQFKDAGPLHRIDAGGTGCMLIKRKVLEKMFEKYQDLMFERGDITINGQRRTMSEDVEFCERATKLGFQIWLDERIKPFHISGFKAVQWSPTQ